MPCVRVIQTGKETILMRISDIRHSGIIAALLTLVVIYAAWKITIFILLIWFILLFWVFNKPLFIESFKPNKTNMSPVLNLIFGEQEKEAENDTEQKEDKNNADT